MKTKLIHGGEDEVGAHYSQDVDPILDRNKQMQAQTQTNKGLRWVGSIPHIATMAWMQQDGIYWPRLQGKERVAYLKKKLNSSDWQHLKTIPGKL